MNGRFPGAGLPHATGTAIRSAIGLWPGYETLVDIFDEVDEDLRADRARVFLTRYGGAIVGAALAIVVAVGAWKSWQWYEARQAAKVADIYFAALRAAAPTLSGQDRQTAQTDLARVTASGADGYRTVSRLLAASVAADAGDLERARAEWDALRSDGSADPLLRDLATLAEVTRQMDKGDAVALAADLKPLLANTNPWHSLAQEADALLDLKRGSADDARETLRKLAADTTAPQGVRQRASGLLGQLGG